MRQDIHVKDGRPIRALVFLMVLASLIPTAHAGGVGKDQGQRLEKGKNRDRAPETESDAKSPWHWKAFDPNLTKEFYQKLETTTVQIITVMDMEVKQDQKQVFYIKWIPQKKNGDNWVVTQRIIGVKMDIDIGGNKISYDSAVPAQPQNQMTEFFKNLLDADLKFTIASKDMRVVKIEGNDEMIRKLSRTNPEWEPLLVSILSEGALKKMAEPTLFAFPTSSARSWKKESTLNLGPIGSYKSNYTFTHAGQELGKQKIDVKADLTYVKPTEKGKLPFVIEDGELTGKDGTGYALFNVAKGRFDYYRIKMKLEGKLKIDINGMKSSVTLSQVQEAIVETSDTNPADAATRKK